MNGQDEMTDATRQQPEPPFSLTPIGEAGAAEIGGLDLSVPLGAAVVEAIRRVLVNYPMLVFRGQSLSGDQQARFSEQFGSLEDHIVKNSDGRTVPIVHTLTNLDDAGNVINLDIVKLNHHWHSDKSYHAVPAFVTILHALEVPANGGDTQFSNATAAWTALPPETKARLEGLQVVHDWVASRRNSDTTPAPPDQIEKRPPVTHPLVCTHPETGAKSLYLGVHVSHVEGMPDAESQALIAELTAHIGEDRFLYTHRWQKGDVVMWDNRCLHHRALPNYDTATERRVLNRTVITGTRPV